MEGRDSGVPDFKDHQVPSILEEQQHIDLDSQADLWELLMRYLKVGKGEAVFCVDPDCFRGPSSHKSSVGDSQGRNRMLLPPGRCPW